MREVIFMVLVLHLVIFEGQKPIMCPESEAGAAIGRVSMGGRDIVGTLGL